mmetsp:Transcript_81655/g.221224  ORF Transcript_81655/g.221224 Transcript_81655/m.221224 type:complete len:490 (-) Transcript_81655:285-1754(-)
MAASLAWGAPVAGLAAGLAPASAAAATGTMAPAAAGAGAVGAAGAEAAAWLPPSLLDSLASLSTRDSSSRRRVFASCSARIACFCRFARLSDSAFSRTACRFLRRTAASNSQSSLSGGESAESSSATACHSGSASTSAASSKSATISVIASAPSSTAASPPAAQPSAPAVAWPAAAGSADAPPCRGGHSSSRAKVSGGGPCLVSRSCRCRARRLPTSSAARSGTESARCERPVTLISTAETSANTFLSIASLTSSGGFPSPGSITARKTEAVGQFTSTVWQRFPSNSPTCSHCPSTSSASASSSEPRTVATQRSSALPSSCARRCVHWASRNAQLTVTGIADPAADSSGVWSPVALKSRLRHMLLAELRRSSNSRAAASAAGPTTGPSPGVLLSSTVSAFDTILHFAGDGALGGREGVAPSCALTLPTVSTPEMPASLPQQKMRLSTRIACAPAMGGRAPGLLCAKTAKHSVSAPPSASVRRAAAPRLP